MALPTESREIKDFDPAAALALLTKFLVQQVGDATEYGTGQQIVDLVSANIDKTDVGLGNVDNVQQQPLNALLSDIANLLGTVAKGDLLVYNGSDFVRLARGTDGQVLVAELAQPTGLKWAPQSGGGGAGIALLWNYSTTTTEADPGSGAFRLDHNTIALATEAYISTDDANGIDAALLLNSLKVGDRLYFQKPSDATNAALVRVTGITDNTTWVKVTFAVEDAGTSATWTDTDTFGVMLMFSGVVSAPITQQAIVSKVYLDDDTVYNGEVVLGLDVELEGDARLGWDGVAHRWTPTIAGWYRLTAGAQATGAVTDAMIYAKKNGADRWQGGRGDNVGESFVSPLIYLNGSTDYLEVWQYSGASRTVRGDGAGPIYWTWAELELVAPTASIFQTKDVTPGDTYLEFDLTGITGHDGPLLIDLIGIVPTADGAGALEAEYKIGGSWITAGYAWTYNWKSPANASPTYEETTSTITAFTSAIRLIGTLGSDPGESVEVSVRLENPFGAFSKHMRTNGSFESSAGSNYGFDGYGVLPNTGVIQGIRFKIGGTTFAAGKAILRSPYNAGGGGGGGGHVIKDKDDATLTQRDNLRFMDGLDARDNSTDGATEVFLDSPPAPLAVRGVYRPTSNVSLLASTPTKIPMGTVLEASPNFVLDSGDAKCVVPGRYWVHFDLPLSSSASWYSDVILYKNGAPYQQGGYGKQATDIMRRAGGFMVDLDVDDTIYFQMATFPASTVTTVARMEIYELTPRLTGVRLPEMVEVNTPDATSYVDNVQAPVVFTNEVEDADGLYNPANGEYTAKVDTMVLACVHLLSDGVSWSQGNATNLYVDHFSGGSWTSYRIDYDLMEAAATNLRSVLTGSIPIFIRAGEKLRVSWKQQRGVNTQLFQSTTVWARFIAVPYMVPTPDIPAERTIVKVGISTGQGIANSVEEKILFDTVIDDAKGWFNAGSNRIDIKEDGKFDFHCAVTFAFDANEVGHTETRVRLVKNGTTEIGYYMSGADTQGSNGRSGRCVAEEIPLVAGDYVEAYIWIYDIASGTGDRPLSTSDYATFFTMRESIANMAVRGAGVGTVLNAPVVVWPDKAISITRPWTITPLDFRGLVNGNNDGGWDLSSGIYKPKHDGWMMAAFCLMFEGASWSEDGIHFYVQASDDQGSTWTALTQRIGEQQPYAPGSGTWARASATGPFQVRHDWWYRLAIEIEGSGSVPLRNTTESLLMLTPIMTGEATAHLPTWIPYTPTIYGWTSGFGTATGRYKNLGDELDVEVFIPITGAVGPAATPLQVGIPAGFIIDPIVTLTENNQTRVGWTFVRDADADDSFSGSVGTDVDDFDRVYPLVNAVAGSYIRSLIPTNAIPVTFASGDSIHMRFKVPVKRA